MIEQAPGVTRLRSLQAKAVRRQRSAEDRRQIRCWITPPGSICSQRLESAMQEGGRVHGSAERRRPRHVRPPARRPARGHVRRAETIHRRPATRTSRVPVRKQGDEMIRKLSLTAAAAVLAASPSSPTPTSSTSAFGGGLPDPPPDEQGARPLQRLRGLGQRRPPSRRRERRVHDQGGDDRHRRTKAVTRTCARRTSSTSRSSPSSRSRAEGQGGGQGQIRRDGTLTITAWPRSDAARAVPRLPPRIPGATTGPASPSTPPSTARTSESSGTRRSTAAAPCSATRSGCRSTWRRRRRRKRRELGARWPNVFLQGNSRSPEGANSP